MDTHSRLLRIAQLDNTLTHWVANVSVAYLEAETTCERAEALTDIAATLRDVTTATNEAADRGEIDGLTAVEIGFHADAICSEQVTSSALAAMLARVTDLDDLDDVAEQAAIDAIDVIDDKFVDGVCTVEDDCNCSECERIEAVSRDVAVVIEELYELGIDAVNTVWPAVMNYLWGSDDLAALDSAFEYLDECVFDALAYGDQERYSQIIDAAREICASVAVTNH
jgi:hypothetical protein